jgi:L-fuconolactonase
MQSLKIVDSHVHLYDPATNILSWIADVPRLNRPHLSPEYGSATLGHEVTDFVFVEVDAMAGKNIKEIEWLTTYSRNEPRLKAMVASFPLEQGAACEADIARYSENPLARGVRRLIQGHVDEPGWCLRPKFIEGVQLLAKYGLSFDVCIKHPQMGDAIELAERCPHVKFVLDHIGKPGIAAGYKDPWRGQMKKLARLTNVWCKISGVITEGNHGTWTATQVTPYVEEAIAAFGFDRVMFGSDWPVVNLASSFGQWVEIANSVVSTASISEQEKFWRQNAKAFYRF